MVAPYLYGGELAAGLRRLKYDRRDEIARSIGRWVSDDLEQLVIELRAPLIVPVPSHWRTRLERGMDHVLELVKAARPSARITCALRKVRRTARQAALSRNQRSTNLKRAFVANQRYRARYRDQPVILFDDIVTSMATAEACARALLEAGAASVNVFAIARAVD